MVEKETKLNISPYYTPNHYIETKGASTIICHLLEKQRDDKFQIVTERNNSNNSYAVNRKKNVHIKRRIANKYGVS